MSAARPKPAPVVAPRAAANRRRIFVVEDHELMCKSLIATLEREADLTVCGTADDAPEALAAIADLKPDLVVTDLTLRSSNGLDLIRTLHDRTPQLPIVALTMFNVRENRRFAHAAGATEFVSKQEGPDALISSVRSVLHLLRSASPEAS